MKRKAWWICLCWCLLLYGTARAQRLLSLEEAREAVRRFEGVSDLRLQYVGIDWSKHRISVWKWPCYLFLADGPNVSRVGYAVDPYTGQIMRRTDYRVPVGYRADHSSKKPVADMVSAQQAYQSITRFIQAQEPGFDPAKYQTIISVQNGHYAPYRSDIRFEDYDPDISFQFSREITNATGEKIWLPTDYAYGVLHSETGQVGEYRRINFPLTAPLEPQITEDQAKRIALGVMRRLGKPYAQVERLRLRFQENANYPDCVLLCWAIGVGYAEENWEEGKSLLLTGVGIVVHAVTGEVLTLIPGWPLDDLFGQPTREEIEQFRQMPPVEPPWSIDVAGRLGGAVFYPPPYVHHERLYVKPTFAWLCGVRVEETEGGFQLKGVHQVRMGMGQTLEHDGERWLPLDAVAEASSAKVEWDPVGRSLAIWPCYPGPEEGHPSPSGRALQGGSTAPE